MRRGIRLVMSTATLVVVGVGLRASAQPHPATNATSSAQAGSTTTHSTPPIPKPSATRTESPSRPHPTAHTSPRPSPSKAVTVTVSGDLVQTDYGPVQVEISVRSGRITNARALTQPSGDGRTDSINSYAIPQLDQEALAAQNAQIDTVSGASFTSDGYRQSLQSALDAAHRAGAR